MLLLLLAASTNGTSLLGVTPGVAGPATSTDASTGQAATVDASVAGELQNWHCTSMYCKKPCMQRLANWCC
jgi:hypothetical protein